MAGEILQQIKACKFQNNKLNCDCIAKCRYVYLQHVANSLPSEPHLNMSYNGKCVSA